MKIRALLWDDVPHQGHQSRRGPKRDRSQTHQAVRDLEYLKEHAYQVIEGTVIDEKSRHWTGPTDSVFNSNPNP